MGVNHGGLHVLVPQEFLHCPDVVADFQELRGKRMSKGMACGTLGQYRISHGDVHRLLDDRFVNVMPSFFSRFFVLPAVFLRKHPLPAPFLRSIGIFPVQRVRKQHTAQAVGKVALVDRLDGIEMLLQRRLERQGQLLGGAIHFSSTYFVLTIQQRLQYSLLTHWGVGGQ